MKINPRLQGDDQLAIQGAVLRCSRCHVFFMQRFGDAKLQFHYLFMAFHFYTYISCIYSMHLC